MSQEILQPDEIEKEAHIVHERIIEETPGTQQQEEDQPSLLDQLIKATAYTIGSVILLMITLGLFKLILEGGIISTLIGIAAALFTLRKLHGFTEE